MILNLRTLCLISFLLVSVNVEANTFNEVLLAFKLKYNDQVTIHNFKSLITKLSSHELLTASFQQNNIKYKLEIINKYENEKFRFASSNLIALTMAAYEDQPTPYSGTITNVTKCAKTYRPKIYKTQIGFFNIETVETGVNSNFEIGICEEKLLTYNSCSSYVYLDNIKSYLKLNVLIPRSKGSCLIVGNNFFKNLRFVNEH